MMTTNVFLSTVYTGAASYTAQSCQAQVRPSVNAQGELEQPSLMTKIHALTHTAHPNVGGVRV